MDQICFCSSVINLTTLITKTQKGKIKVTHKLRLMTGNYTSARTLETRASQRGIKPVRKQMVPSKIIKTPAMRNA